MSLLLYINGQLTDLDAGQIIAQTKQVNDLNSLDNRQASYTNKFKLPKTATNVKIMDYLTVTGNNSNIPYQKNECSLFSATGECFVYKGWAVITDAGNDYEAVIYDGIIDLYKAIENISLGNLGLSELTHKKTVDEAINTWQNYLFNPQDTKYLYILADYNGNTGATNITDSNAQRHVNIDYLIPSVNVKWLWDKIFSTFNYTYEGGVFNTQNFKNLWMTFPKALNTTGDNNVTLFNSSNYTFPYHTSSALFNFYYARFTTAQTNTLPQYTNNIHLKVGQAGTYMLKIKGILYGKKTVNDEPRNSRIVIGKNAEAITGVVGFGVAPLLPGGNVFGTAADDLPQGIEFNLESESFQLNTSDSICLVVTGSANGQGYMLAPNSSNSLEVTLVRTDANEVNFAAALTDFSIKDFLNEIVQRFGLTMFTAKDSKEYTFLTLQEQLQTANVLNWSSKFDKKISENYVYGSYAQRNWFKYNYNDKESTHNDDYLPVNNINLPDNKDVIKSKIYSPEKIKTTYLGNAANQQNTNVYKFWDKEVIENPEPGKAPIEYKPLDKRYYFMRAQSFLESINVYSDSLGQLMQTGISFRENYTKLRFNDILDDYYAPLQNILQAALIVKAQLWLNEADVAGLDFKKLVYIEQLSGNFILNKIDGYIPGKPTKCELVRVQHTLPYAPNTNFILNNINITGSNQVSLSYTQNITGIAGMLQISNNSVSWTNFGYITVNPYTTYTLQPGTYYFRVSCLGYSNVLSINIPS